MARREQTTTKHPDVAASQDDLAILEGRKDAVQKEILVLAENKKQLEADFKTSTEKLDHDLKEKREAHMGELAELSDSIRDTRVVLKKLEADKKTHADELIHLDEKRGAIVKDINTFHGKRSALVNEIGTLETRIKELGHIRDTLRTDIKTLETSKTDLEKKVHELTEKIRIDGEAHDRIIAHKQLMEGDHAKLVVSKNDTQNELDALNHTIKEKIDELAGLKASIIEVQKEVSDHKQVITAADVEISTRNANAARLEAHVSAKLTELKELEQHFTTEHLARVGYKKTE